MTFSISSNLDDTLHPDNATRAWDVLSERVERFIDAWEETGEPPPLADYLPASPAALRRMALVELIKVDLEYRWRDRRLPRRIEEYLADFPELAVADRLPCDLIYEEYHVRRQSGDDVDVQQYFDRFPGQSDELGRLLGLEAPHLTTTMVATERPTEVEPGGQIDDFDLLLRLGKGAFASVFLARQRSMQRHVALKISADSGAEPQTLAQLDHQNIVRVYDQRVLPEKRTRLLYMQYVPGGTLQSAIEHARRTNASERTGKTLLAAVDACLEQRGEAPTPESSVRQRLAAATWPIAVCWMGSRVAHALDYAHQRGVLHRDVKPANVLLAADGSPKLADFNISFASQLEGATPAAYFGGSLAYMSPEQLEACNPSHPRKAEDLDGRSDAYSLGVLLWEMLTASRPFDDRLADAGYATTLEEMARRRYEGVPAAALARLPPNCPAGLEHVLLKCLSPRPEDRYATAGHFARQLELCLQPRAQQLFRPRQRDWRRTAQRWPLAALLLAGLLPNFLMSSLNTLYNVQRVVPEEQIDYFNKIIFPIVNLVAYPLGVGVLIALAWPVARSVGHVARGLPPPTGEGMYDLRRRCLGLGDLVAAVSLAEWVATAIVFSIWLSLVAPGNFNAATQQYLHMTCSQILCGMIAATLSFFCVAYVLVSAFYPILAPPEISGMQDTVSLEKLARRVGRYFAGTVLSPFLAGILLAAIQTDVDPKVFQAQRIFAVILGVLGVVGFGLAYTLAGAIRRDISALISAVNPDSALLSSHGDSSDSFWTGSRSSRN